MASSNPPTTTSAAQREEEIRQGARAATAEAEVRVEHAKVGFSGWLRNLFSRTRRTIAAFRDGIVAGTKEVWNQVRGLWRRVTRTAAGKAVLSGFGMAYTAQLAIGSGRFLAYSVGSGLAYFLTQVAAVGFIVLGTAWFLQFSMQLVNALTAHPNLTPAEARS